MAYSKKTRTKARSLYVHSRFSLPVISATLDVSPGTLTRWKGDAKHSGDDWDMARSAATLAGEGFDKLVSEAVEGFTIMFQATMDEIREAKDVKASEKVKMMASLSDAFNKMVNAAGRSAPNLSKMGIAVKVLELQLEFVHEHYEQHATAFQEVLEPFGHAIAREYSE